MSELYAPSEFPVRPLAIIGPSGSGKSSIVEELVRRELVSLNPTWTDRQPRGDEPEFEHRFVSVSEMGRLAAEGFFLKVVQPFGLEYRYGLPALEYVPPKVPVAMLRAWFIAEFSAFYADPLVYQIEASKEDVEKVLLARGDNNLGTRLSDYEKEVLMGRALANRVFRHELDGSFAVVQSIADAIKEDLLGA